MFSKVIILCRAVENKELTYSKFLDMQILIQFVVLVVYIQKTSNLQSRKTLFCMQSQQLCKLKQSVKLCKCKVCLCIQSCVYNHAFTEFFKRVTTDNARVFIAKGAFIKQVQTQAHPCSLSSNTFLIAYIVNWNINTSYNVLNHRRQNTSILVIIQL